MAKEKPITIVREEFVNNLVELINSSGLPFFVVLDVLKSTEVEVKAAAAKQYEKDKLAYENEKDEVIVDELT